MAPGAGVCVLEKRNTCCLYRNRTESSVFQLVMQSIYLPTEAFQFHLAKQLMSYLLIDSVMHGDKSQNVASFSPSLATIIFFNRLCALQQLIHPLTLTKSGSMSSLSQNLTTCNVFSFTDGGVFSSHEAFRVRPFSSHSVRCLQSSSASYTRPELVSTIQASSLSAVIISQPRAICRLLLISGPPLILIRYWQGQCWGTVKSVKCPSIYGIG